MKTPHGYAVVIDHTPRKVATFYTHMEKLFVPEVAPGKKGIAVRAGQPLGVIGASPLDGEHLKHLHFEVWTAPGRVGGTAVDPLPWLVVG